MTKAAYSPIAEAAAKAFNECVDALVIKKLDLPPLTPDATLSGERFTGAQNVGAPDTGIDGPKL